MKSYKRRQLYWFINNLIFLSNEPITFEGFDEYVCFPVSKLKENGLFSLHNDIKIESSKLDQTHIICCEEMLTKIKKDIHKIDGLSQNYNEDKFSWFFDEKGTRGNGCAYYIDCDINLFKKYAKYRGENDMAGKTIILEDDDPEHPKDSLPNFSTHSTMKPAFDIQDKKSLIWFFKTLKESGERDLEYGTLYIDLDKLCKEPFFKKEEESEPIYVTLERIENFIKTDKDFLKKNNFTNYNIKIGFDTRTASFTGQDSDINYDIIAFTDFTDELIGAYLEHRLGVKTKIQKVRGKTDITRIDILKNKTGSNGIILFANEEYNIPIEFENSNSSRTLYNLADKKTSHYIRGVFDYLNSGKENPLYKKYNYNVSKIFKKDRNYILPNIPMKLVTQKFISQRRSKSA